jgi:hypothetical protein
MAESNSGNSRTRRNQLPLYNPSDLDNILKMNRNKSLKSGISEDTESEIFQEVIEEQETDNQINSSEMGNNDTQNSEDHRNDNHTDEEPPENSPNVTNSEHNFESLRRDHNFVRQQNKDTEKSSDLESGTDDEIEDIEEAENFVREKLKSYQLREIQIKEKTKEVQKMQCNVEKKRKKQRIREQLKRLTEMEQKLAEKETELDETLYKLRAHEYRDANETSQTYVTTKVATNKPNRGPISSTDIQRTPNSQTTIGGTDKSGPNIVTNTSPQVTLTHGSGSGVQISDIKDIITTICNAVNSNRPESHSSSTIKQKPLSFDGNRDKAVDWLEDFESVSRHNGWDNEKKAECVRFYLESSAKDWYAGSFGNKPLRWKDFTKNFNTAFRPKAYQRTARIEFHRARILRDETPTAFVYRVLKLAKRVEEYLPEEEIVDQIKDGLKSSEFAVSLINCETINELSEALAELENIKAFKDSRNRSQNKTGGYVGKANSVKNNNREPQPPHQSGEQESMAVNTSRTQKEKVYILPEMRGLCANCREKGHLLRDCLRPKDRDRINANWLEFRGVDKDGEPVKEKFKQERNKSRKSTQSEPEEQTQPKVIASFNTATESTNDWSHGRINSVFNLNPQPNRRLNPNKEYPLQDCNLADVPVVKVMINGVSFDALMDSGAAISCVSPAVAKNFPERRAHWHKNKVHGVNGKRD